MGNKLNDACERVCPEWQKSYEEGHAAGKAEWDERIKNLEDGANLLFDQIAHGDDEHRKWLNEDKVDPNDYDLDRARTVDHEELSKIAKEREKINNKENNMGMQIVNGFLFGSGLIIASFVFKFIFHIGFCG